MVERMNMSGVLLDIRLEVMLFFWCLVDGERYVACFFFWSLKTETLGNILLLPAIWCGVGAFVACLCDAADETKEYDGEEDRYKLYI